MDDVEDLKRRVGSVEREVAAVRAVLAERGHDVRVPHPARAQRAVPPAAEMPQVPRVRTRERAARDPEAEAVFVGTWFARLGAVAVLLGAAFGFKYAVDRGWIGPGLRVVLGMIAGTAFVLAAERARAATWPRLAQALAGGGAGLMYLSLWAAFALYSLIPAWVAFAGLAAVSVLAAAMALRHDSPALAVLALGGGFLDPYLTGFDRMVPALLSYVLMLDLAILALGYFRKWRVVEAAAMAGTWIVALGVEVSSPDSPAIAFAAVYFAVFELRGLVHAIGRGRPTGQLDLVLLGANASAFFGLGTLSLDPDHLGAFAAALGLLHVALSMMVRYRAEPDRVLRFALLGTGIVFLTIAVPIELDGPSVAVIWAIEGAVLVALGRATGLRGPAVSGLGVLGLSIVSSVMLDHQLGTAYEPGRLLFSVDALTFLIQIAALFTVAWLFAHAPALPWSRQASEAAVAVGNALAVAWLTFEAMAAFGHPREAGRPRAFAQLQFTETAIWAFYAIALLSVGVAARLRGARILAVALFGVTLAKLCVIDLWLLEPGHRTIAFIGLGLLLLLGSLMYHRFRDLIVAPSADR